MASKEASVRLTVKDAGFRRGFAGSAAFVKRKAGEMGSSLQSALSAGANGAADALKSAFSSVKGAVTGLSGLMGGIGVASLAHDAVKADGAFRRLAFSIKIGTGELVSHRDLQREVQQAALNSATSSEELAAAMALVFRQTGDAEFARESIGLIGTTARATGEDIDALAKITATLRQKFGVTGADTQEAMAKVIGAINMGGATAENLADDFAEIGGKAKTMGLQGSEGVEKMLGILNLAKKETGRFEQAMTALPQIFDSIIERGGKGGELEKKLKIVTTDGKGTPKDPFEILKDIIAATKGKEDALGELGFGGEGLQTILALSRTYQSELQRTGGDLEASRAAFDSAIKGAAGGTTEWSDVTKEAADRMEGAEARVQRALEQLRQTFSDPEIVGAITDLAGLLPDLAKAIGKVIGFVKGSPGTAGAIALGGVAAKGAVGGMIQGALASGGATAAAAMQAGVAAGGASAAKGLAGALSGGTVATVGAGLVAAAAGIAYDQSKQVRQRRNEEKGFLAEQYDLQGKQGVRHAYVKDRSAFSAVMGGEKGKESTYWLERDQETGEIVKKKADYAKDMSKRYHGGYGTRGKVRSAIGLGDPDPAAAQREAAAQPAKDAAAARAMADALGSKLGTQELRVRITNPESIKLTPTGGGGSTNPPKPGHTPVE